MVNSYALRPAWTPLTIAMMVLGFIVFWPLGLAMIAYIVWGDRIPEIKRHFEGAKQSWKGESRKQNWGCGRHGYAKTGNAAFDDYRAAELQRLEEERRRLDEERREFESFMENLRRARDQEEFDRFKRDREDARRNGGAGSTINL